MAYNYTTSGGIQYEELEGSPTLRATREGYQATQVYRIPWTSIGTFLNESFPPVVKVGGGFYQAPPRSFPGIPYLFTTSVAVEPFDPNNPVASIFSAPNQANTYAAGAKVTIEYSTTTQEASDDLLRTHRMSLGGEMMILPVGGFGWTSEQTDDFVPIQHEDVRIGKVIPTIEHSISFEYVPNPPTTAILDTIGCVNESLWEPLNTISAPAETALFLGADMYRRTTTLGEEAWKLEYRFSQRSIKGLAGELPGGLSDPVGWNHFYHPQNHWWERIKNKQGGNVYYKADFAPLFEPEPASESEPEP